jgi:hypothetical protein
MGVSGPGTVSGEVVFVGYGITSKDPEIDEYAGLDVAGKVVVILRDTPRADNRFVHDGLDRRKYSSMTEKMTNAVAHKAAAILFVNDRDTADDGDDLLPFSYYGGAGPSIMRLPEIPAIHVRRSVVEQMLGARLENLERDIDRDLKPRSAAAAGWTASLSIDVKRTKDALTAKNVVGVLEGAGKLADETVVIGAHYDHIGYSGPLSPAKEKKAAIHHGADDNASGAASVMELARRFAAVPKREGRRLVFVAFSGEECGLYGSDAYCAHPPFPLADTAAMVNLDMTGRLRTDSKEKKDHVLVEGSGTAKTFDSFLDTLAKKHDLFMTKKPSGFGPSDHASFYQKKIPVIFYWTGNHPDYHRPTDTADKINVAGMRKVVELAEDTVAYLAEVPERPGYVKVVGPSMVAAGDGPRLGIVPDYGDPSEGVLLSDVREGGPASKAGLKGGDRIVAMGGVEVKNIEDYTAKLVTLKKGDTIDVVVMRDNQKIVFKVKLE